MKKYFRMLVQNIKTGEKKTYISEHQGGTPGIGWRCLGVLGYFER